MFRALFVLMILMSVFHGLGQKPVIDFAAIKTWQSVSSPKISQDGAYFSYTETNRPVGGKTLVVQSLDASWKNEFINAELVFFTEDNRFVVIKLENDSICISKLGTEIRSYIANVSVIKYGGNYIAYKQKDNAEQLVLINLNSDRSQMFDKVCNYEIDKYGMYLLYQTFSVVDTGRQYNLQSIRLKDDSLITIGRGVMAEGIFIDAINNQFGFTVKKDSLGTTSNSIWYYNMEKNKAELLVDDNSTGINEGFGININADLRFSSDGNKIFFYLAKNLGKKKTANRSNVDIWSYHDSKLQSEQLEEKSARSYECVVNIDSRLTVQLEEENEKIFNLYDQRNDDEVLTSRTDGDCNEWSWNPDGRPTIFLLFTKNGERRIIKTKSKECISEYLSPNCYSLSPDGKFLVYYDQSQGSYLSYEISSGETRNITYKIKVSWRSNFQDDMPISSSLTRGIAGWLDNLSVLIYSRTDIYVLKVDNSSIPINLTSSGSSNRNKIYSLLDIRYNKIRQTNDTLILTSFDPKNKNTGFYAKILGGNINPKLLAAMPFEFEFQSKSAELFKPEQKKSTYIFSRMDATETPNYFATTDFRNFMRLTNVHPEKNYNWLKAELMEWKTFDGTTSKGILYKPEDFDSRKKYPIIFLYYEILSDQLHTYLPPDLSKDEINIPWFVSRGYLVFTPDIHFRIGHPGQSVMNSVVSAAKYLCINTWVDSGRMGLQGHSFGGYETNYLVTHTNIFAAACSGAGTCDFVSSYGALRSNGISNQYIYEQTQSRMGATLWQKPELYISNSPIFRADRVTTPLLLMNNKKDRQVLFAQGVEFFTALRRLNKSVWMLQYDNGGHPVFGKDAEDFTIRLTQFFDHYLKNSPLPKWMKYGVPAKFKGTVTGLELSE